MNKELLRTFGKLALSSPPSMPRLSYMPIEESPGECQHAVGHSGKHLLRAPHLQTFAMRRRHYKRRTPCVQGGAFGGPALLKCNQAWIIEVRASKVEDLSPPCLASLIACQNSMAVPPRLLKRVSEPPYLYTMLFR